ncbi:glycogen debranching protein GlgX [Aestuariibacter halophilus]|uniref:Glycogen debranching protein GlgX n=2 Tax=Fluctibacter halophilus TaxID=226011 RepID=A0ABS8G4D6_9ALTE|nr:glycogen debranching protein GlgX [Aestuariibacter halophilus]
MGATLTATGCNFAVHCPDADDVVLDIFHADTEEHLHRVSLIAKTGKIWHAHVEGIQAGQLYGYRTFGKQLAEMGLIFDPEKLLIDPYAKCLNRPQVWSRRQYQGDSQFMMAKARILPVEPAFFQHPKPEIELADTVLYEAHVKGLTALHPDIPEPLRGKYLGVCHASVIAHLASLGITSIQLMPVMAFMPEPYITEKGLTNYWGYNPVNFFSPDPRYAIDDPVAEFRQMVDVLHGAGLEVILDVVFNHTAEGGRDGPMLSFKGFDNTSFYLFERSEYGVVNFHNYLNNSGCGNSVNTAAPYVLKLVMDALRYWVTDMGVDGFRFDLAASLGRDPYEFSNMAGFFRTLRQDPVLQRVKLIAEPWDIGHGGYRLGQFPSNWVECNDKYRDTVRGFWRGDKGLVGDFATRLLGSRDIFPKGNRSIHSSVNNVTYHDGFTLQDLVSYRERHNEANLEQNRDGHSHNVSDNYGEEGPTQHHGTLVLREKQKRNLFVTLMLSQGIPHVLGGDELSRSQQGNNNAYCQDNEISWLNWTLNERQSDFLTFCQQVIGLRRASKLLHHMSLADDCYTHDCNVAHIRWYRPDGATKGREDWQDPDNQAFAVEILGTADAADEHWFIIFNAFDQDVRFHLPQDTPDGWELYLDTRYAKVSLQPSIKVSEVFLQAYRSVSVFRRVTG